MHDQVPAARGGRHLHGTRSLAVRGENRTVTASPDELDIELILICDHCGRIHDNGDQAPVSWDELWLRATGAGWSGRDRAVGPHFCFR
ncbi:hypothetical protein [Umezawaea sp.]|uniref:hypothetical protein n=1 Tax=Umezawaea sp. TaxID=1955258 RepID=UPI002ED4772B